MTTETRAAQATRLYASTEAISLDDVLRELERAEERGADQALSSQYLTINQAAKFLQCSREAIYCVIRDGRLPVTTSVSGRRLVSRQALVNLPDRRLEPTGVRLSPTMRNVLTKSQQLEDRPKVLLPAGYDNRRTIRALMRRNLIEYNGNIGWCLTAFGETVRATLPEVAS